MQTVILAGGHGTRIRMVAGTLPKSLVPVAGRPFIEHQFDQLKQSGFREVLMCVGYGADAIQAHVGDGSRFGLSVVYSRESPDRLLGTGGALVHALPHLADRFMALYGDSYLPTAYDRLANRFLQSGCPALMTVYPNLGRWDRSNTRIRDGRVVFYSKQARPGEADGIDYGLTFYKRSVIERYRAASMPLDLQTVLQDLIADGQLAADEVRERFYEIGKPEGWMELDDLLGRRSLAAGPEKAVIFMDRDGTINEMVYDEVHGVLDSPHKPEEVRLKKGAAAFICRMRNMGRPIIVITNQPGLAKGTLTEEQLNAVHGRLADMLAENGTAWDALYVCPHYPSLGPGGRPAYTAECLCRKPLPGMFYQAAREHTVDLPRSWMIGDGLNDIQAGRSAGCRTILLTNLKIEQIEKFLTLENAEPDFIASDFDDAETIIRENRL